MTVEQHFEPRPSIFAVVRVRQDRKAPIMQTSAKSHIGHLEANAGQAGIIKCTLAKFPLSKPAVFWCGYGSIPIDTFLVGWTSIYQLFWCSPGVQGFDTLPCEQKIQYRDVPFFWTPIWVKGWFADLGIFEGLVYFSAMYLRLSPLFHKNIVAALITPGLVLLFWVNNRTNHVWNLETPTIGCVSQQKSRGISRGHNQRLSTSSGMSRGHSQRWWVSYMFSMSVHIQV